MCIQKTDEADIHLLLFECVRSHDPSLCFYTKIKIAILSFQNLKIQDLKVSAIALHRDIFIAARELRLDPSSLPAFQLADSVPLYLYPQGHSQYLGDTNILGKSSAFS